MLVDLLRRLTRARAAATLVAIVAAAAISLAPAPARAASGARTTFAAVVDRSALIIVATVMDAPTVSAGYRLSVDRVLKGSVGATLTFAPDPMAVALTPGQRVVLLLTDPSGLDFRGTTVLPVASDGTIDPDGLAAVPATLTDLEAAYGGASPGGASPGGASPGGASPGGSPSVPPTATSVPAEPTARDPVALLLLLAAASFAAGAAVVVARSALSRRRRA